MPLPNSDPAFYTPLATKDNGLFARTHTMAEITNPKPISSIDILPGKVGSAEAKLTLCLQIISNSITRLLKEQINLLDLRRLDFNLDHVELIDTDSYGDIWRGNYYVVGNSFPIEVKLRQTDVKNAAIKLFIDTFLTMLSPSYPTILDAPKLEIKPTKSKSKRNTRANTKSKKS